MKILAIAYACNPYRGSEHGVGWGWIKMIAESHVVHVIASAFEKEDIMHWLDQHPECQKRMRFYFPKHRKHHYHNQSKFWLKIENSPFKIVMNMAYRLWERDGYELAQMLHQKNDYDLCHLITYVGFRFPDRFHQLDCPFVWGPIGGLENTPWRFMPLLGWYGATYYTARNLINDLDRRFLPAPRKAFRKAAEEGGVIAATSGIKKEIKKWYGQESNVICEIGPPSVHPQGPIPTRQDQESLIICWSGQHLPGKALQLLLHALAKTPAIIDWRLDVLGSGPCTKKWQKTASDAGVLHRCKFHGNLPRREALAVMQQSHLFVITSLKDLTSTVLLEALALGKPVIAPDHCGFSDVITDACGIKIPITNIDEFVTKLSSHIRYIYENESLRMELSRGALDRIKQFGWGAKGRVLEQIYQSAIKNRPDSAGASKMLTCKTSC